MEIEDGTRNSQMVQSDTQGYGFIQPQGGGEDVFVQVFAASVLG